MTRAQQLARQLRMILEKDPYLWCRGEFRDLFIGKPAKHVRAYCLHMHICRLNEPERWDRSILEPFERAAGKPLQLWNDALGRTVRDVIYLLKKVETSK